MTSEKHFLHLSISHLDGFNISMDPPTPYPTPVSISCNVSLSVVRAQWTWQAWYQHSPQGGTGEATAWENDRSHVTAQMALSTSKFIFFQLSMLAESALLTITSPKFPDLTCMLGSQALLKPITMTQFTLAKAESCPQPYSHRNGVRMVPQREIKMLLPK